MVLDGQDPKDQRDAQRAELAPKRSHQITFDEALIIGRHFLAEKIPITSSKLIL